jgi:hypothetical protein
MKKKQNTFAKNVVKTFDELYDMIHKHMSKKENKNVDVSVFIAALEELFFGHIEFLVNEEQEAFNNGKKWYAVIDKKELKRLVMRTCKCANISIDDILSGLEEVRQEFSREFMYNEQSINKN